MPVLCRNTSFAHKVMFARLQCVRPDSECVCAFAMQEREALCVCVCVCGVCVCVCVCACAAREPRCLNVVRQFLITWPSARAAAEWLTTILEHYWRKHTGMRGGEEKPGQWQRMKMRKDGRTEKKRMRTGQSCRKQKHTILVINNNAWECSNNCSTAILNDKRSNKISKVWLYFLCRKRKKKLWRRPNWNRQEMLYNVLGLCKKPKFKFLFSKNNLFKLSLASLWEK